MLVVDGDARRREVVAGVARACVEARGGGRVVTAATVEEAAPAAVVVGAGEAGLAALGRLAAAHDPAPRIAVAEAADARRLIALVGRARPFAVVAEPIVTAELEAAIGRALVEAAPPTVTGETEAAQPADFERLTVDGATGVLAPGYLRLRLAEEAERARRYARPIALGLIDVDGLRAIADERGPRAAAALTRHVGEQLLRGARAVDLVGRWAAGAFAVLLPETLAGSAWGICERLRRAAAAPLTADGRPLAARLSAGVAAGPRRARTADELAARADAALWRAKRAGGDRTIADDDR